MPAAQPLSLLWPTGRATAPIGRLADEAIADLHLAEIVSAIVGADAPAGRLAARERFAQVDDWLRERGLQSERRVGNAHARLARARDVVNVALEHLADDPLVFLHPPSARCTECDEARRSVR